MDDTISRKAAIDEGMSYINGDCFCDKEDFAKYIEFIEQLPSAGPELIKCDYVKACNEVTMNKTFSAWRYLAMLDDFEEEGYILVKKRG